MSRTAFVAKAELAQQLFSGTFLRLIGPLFVERFDDAHGRGDLDAVIEAVWARRLLADYPNCAFSSEMCNVIMCRPLS